MNLFSTLKTSVSKLLNQSFIYSVSYNNIFLAKYFIQCGADVNIADVNINTLNEFGYSPLDIAARLGYQRMAELLLENGANINILDKFGCSPLHIAALKDNLKMVKLLLNNGANINTLNEFGYSPLYIAVEQGNQEIVELLLNNGADVNRQDKLGNYPLHIAVKQGNQEIVKLLLNNGATPTLKNKQGNTLLDTALEKDNQSIVKLLRKAIEPYSFTVLHSAVIFGDTEQVKKLLEASPNVDAQDPQGQTPLYHAAERGQDTIAKLLLDANANTEIKDSLGQTPLLVAQNPEIFTLLLDHSADVTVVTSEKDQGAGTCWHWFNVPFVLEQYQTNHIQNIKIPTEEFHLREEFHDLNANNVDNALLLTGEESAA